MEILSVLLYILFVLAAIVLVVVILLQEGKGGGLTGALGTEGQQTFGVGTKGVNRFTSWTCALFLGTALAIHFVNRREVSRSVVGDDTVLPDTSGTPGVGSTPPAGPGSTPPGTPPPAEQPK